MNRTTVNDIAKSLGGIISPDTIRNWVDEGVLPAEKDFRGWRWFPNPEKTIQRVQDLIYGNVGEELPKVEAGEREKESRR